MHKNFKNALVMTLVVMLTFLQMGLHAATWEEGVAEGTGSLTIRLRNTSADVTEDQSLDSVKVPTKGTVGYTLYKVANFNAEKGRFEYADGREFTKTQATPTDTVPAEFITKIPEVKNSVNAGEIKFEGLELGRYLALQTTKNEGTVMSNNFYVDIPGYSKSPEGATDNTKYTKDIMVYPKNTLTLSGLTIIKNDGETGEQLEGAKINIQKAEGTLVESDTLKQVGQEWYVFADGSKDLVVPKTGLVLEGLEPGKYIVSEVLAPTGYIGTESVARIEVKSDGTIIEWDGEIHQYPDMGEGGASEMSMPGMDEAHPAVFPGHKQSGEGTETESITVISENYTLAGTPSARKLYIHNYKEPTPPEVPDDPGDGPPNPDDNTGHVSGTGRLIKRLDLTSNKVIIKDTGVNEEVSWYIDVPVNPSTRLLDTMVITDVLETDMKFERLSLTVTSIDAAGVRTNYDSLLTKGTDWDNVNEVVTINSTGLVKLSEKFTTLNPAPSIGTKVADHKLVISLEVVTKLQAGESLATSQFKSNSVKVGIQKPKSKLEEVTVKSPDFVRTGIVEVTKKLSAEPEGEVKASDVEFKLYYTEAGSETPNWIELTKVTTGDADSIVYMASTDISKEGVAMVKPGGDVDATTSNKIKIYGLNPTKTYYLVETKAPDGYRPLTKPMQLELSTTNTDVDVEVVNNKGPLIPITGGIGTMVGIILVVGLGFWAILWGRKKKEDEEKVAKVRN